MYKIKIIEKIRGISVRVPLISYIAGIRKVPKTPEDINIHGIKVPVISEVKETPAGYYKKQLAKHNEKLKRSSKDKDYSSSKRLKPSKYWFRFSKCEDGSIEKTYTARNRYAKKDKFNEKRRYYYNLAEEELTKYYYNAEGEIYKIKKINPNYTKSSEVKYIPDYYDVTNEQNPSEICHNIPVRVVQQRGLSFYEEKRQSFHNLYQRLHAYSIPERQKSAPAPFWRTPEGDYILEHIRQFNQINKDRTLGALIQPEIIIQKYISGPKNGESVLHRFNSSIKEFVEKHLDKDNQPTKIIETSQNFQTIRDLEFHRYKLLDDFTLPPRGLVKRNRKNYVDSWLTTPHINDGSNASLNLLPQLPSYEGPK